MESSLIYNASRIKVLGIPVNALSLESATQQIIQNVKKKAFGYVCLYNSHMAATVQTNAPLRKALDAAQLVLPDGMPIAMTMSVKRRIKQMRVAGPDLLLSLCEAASAEGISVYFLGSTEATLRSLVNNITIMFSSIQIAGLCSPRFGEFDASYNETLIKDINSHSPGITFVGLGCPKQEIWMLDHADKIQSLLIGVGAAFDFSANTKKRAPKILQVLALEWLYRLMQEPGRLAKRYAVTNTLFIYHTLVELLQWPFSRIPPHRPS